MLRHMRLQEGSQCTILGGRPSFMSRNLPAEATIAAKTACEITGTRISL